MPVKSKESETHYDIDRILQHKPKSAKKASQAKSYLIKWANYTTEEATWETATSIRGTAQVAIDEYWPALGASADSDDMSFLSPPRRSTREKSTTKKDEKDDNDGPEATYEVEDILEVIPTSANNSKEAKRYLVKWKGFSRDEATREPADRMEIDIPAKVNEFWRKHAAKLRSKNSKSKEGKAPNASESKKTEEGKVDTEPRTSKRGRTLKPSSATTAEITAHPAKKVKVSPPKREATRAARKSKPETSKKEEATVVASVNDIAKIRDNVESLLGRFENLEKKGNDNSDRDLLVELSQRSDLPEEVLGKIQSHLKIK